jgi:hypothetical protein
LSANPLTFQDTAAATANHDREFFSEIARMAGGKPGPSAPKTAIKGWKFQWISSLQPRDVMAI